MAVLQLFSCSLSFNEIRFYFMYCGTYQEVKPYAKDEGCNDGPDIPVIFLFFFKNRKQKQEDTSGYKRETEQEVGNVFITVRIGHEKYLVFMGRNTVNNGWQK